MTSDKIIRNRSVDKRIISSRSVRFAIATQMKKRKGTRLKWLLLRGCGVQIFRPVLSGLIVTVLFYGGLARDADASAQRKGDSRPKSMATGEGSQKKRSGEIGRNIDEYLERATPFGFSGVVLVAKDGKVILRKGYGFADKDRQVRNDTKTLFLIGSVSKQFTAAAILKLEMDGKLKTGDQIKMYLRDVPPDKSEITLHQLLTHTSGLPTSYPSFGDSPALNLSDGVTRALKTPLALPVGSEYSYSNIGYLLLAGIVENVSKTPFRNYLRQNLFQPAGMSSTGFVGDVGKRRLGPVAHGYNRSTDWGSPDGRLTRKASFGFGDVMSTVDDLFKWQAALQNNKVLSAAETTKLFTPAVKVEKGVDYGYGWNILSTPRGTTLIEHGGDASPEGWTADFRWYRDENVVVIITSNEMRDTWGVRHSIEEALDRIIFERPYENLPPSITLSPKQLAKYVGTYQLSTGGKVLVRSENDHLTVAVEGQAGINHLLTDLDKKSIDRFYDLNKRTAAIVEGISKDNYSPLRDALAAIGIDLTVEKARERYGVRWIDWKSLEEKYGKFKNYEVLGTTPAYDNMSITHIRLNFERGSTISRWYWWSHGLERVYADEFLPASNPLAPQSKKLFVSFDLYINKKAFIDFDLAPDGTVRGLSIVGKDVNAKALKTE